jgi:hypothetical protein
MLDIGSRILDQCITSFFLLIKRTEYLDLVSSIKYLISERVVHHRYESLSNFQTHRGLVILLFNQV